MRKITTIIITISLVLINCSTSTNKESSKWVGEYEYATILGITAGGTGMMQSILFDIKVEDGEIKCMYYEDGWQTMQRMVLTGIAEGNMLKLYFDKWGEDNAFAREGYKKGDLVNTIELKDGKYIVKFLKNKFMPDDYVFEKRIKQLEKE